MITNKPSCEQKFFKEQKKEDYYYIKNIFHRGLSGYEDRIESNNNKKYEKMRIIKKNTEVSYFQYFPKVDRQVDL